MCQVEASHASLILSDPWRFSPQSLLLQWHSVVLNLCKDDSEEDETKITAITPFTLKHRSCLCNSRSCRNFPLAPFRTGPVPVLPRSPYDLKQPCGSCCWPTDWIYTCTKSFGALTTANIRGVSAESLGRACEKAVTLPREPVEWICVKHYCCWCWACTTWSSRHHDLSLWVEVDYLWTAPDGCVDAWSCEAAQF